MEGRDVSVHSDWETGTFVGEAAGRNMRYAKREQLLVRMSPPDETEPAAETSAVQTSSRGIRGREQEGAERRRGEAVCLVKPAAATRSVSAYGAPG